MSGINTRILVIMCPKSSLYTYTPKIKLIIAQELQDITVNIQAA